jgi:hypothetical protein
MNSTLLAKPSATALSNWAPLNAKLVAAPEALKRPLLRSSLHLAVTLTVLTAAAARAPAEATIFVAFGSFFSFLFCALGAC